MHHLPTSSSNVLLYELTSRLPASLTYHLAIIYHSTDVACTVPLPTLRSALKMSGRHSSKAPLRFQFGLTTHGKLSSARLRRRINYAAKKHKVRPTLRHQTSLILTIHLNVRITNIAHHHNHDCNRVAINYLSHHPFIYASCITPRNFSHPKNPHQLPQYCHHPSYKHDYDSHFFIYL